MIMTLRAIRRRKYQMETLAALYRPIAFAYPRRLVQPSSWCGHIPFAFWLIEAQRPNILVELGTHSGNSYCAFLQAVKELKLTAKCFAIDTWKGDEHSGLYGDDVFLELARYHDEHYAGISKLIRSTFDQALDDFTDNTVDILHIDGFHSYEASKHDFDSWLPKLSERAIVLFHDTNVREREFGVWKLWSELSGKYPNFNFDHSHGLGVLGVGKMLSPQLSWLLNLNQAPSESVSARTVQSFFERLGSGLVDKLDLEMKSAALETASAELNAKSERLKKLENERKFRNYIKLTIQSYLRYPFSAKRRRQFLDSVAFR
jgi:methyltransferase family protein